MLLCALTLSQALTLDPDPDRPPPDHPLTTPLTTPLPSCTSPGPLNNEEQKRATAVLARRKKMAAAGFDSKEGLQYALDHCTPLRVLVHHICEYIGGCRG